MSTSYLDVPVFAGQGTEAADSLRTHEQALHDATSPSGALLLASCFDAFHRELSGLSLPEIELSRIDRAAFSSPKDIISSLPQHSDNPIISSTKLFMFQSLRYLGHVESSTNSPSRFTDAMKANASCNLGVLGFSSGILVASVVAASQNTLMYISISVEAFRLAFWIGMRTQEYRMNVLGVGEESLPWSVVLLGTNRKDADVAIEAFRHKNTDASSLSITAVTDDICLTISGHPIHLEAFTSTLPANITVHKTTLNTLYHSPSQLASVREQVLKDVKDRVIKFPEFSELIAPIRSTNTGELLDGGTASGLLVEAVVDMLLIQPVNWDRVVSSLAKVLPASSDIKLGDPSCIRLLNFGPGTGLMRSTEKSCRLSDGTSVDLIFDATRVGGKKPKQEPIAIVGMAVNMPGAPNTTKLWEVLEKGINTCSEIPESRFKVSDYTNAFDPKSTRTLKAHTGNFISTASSFDHRFFNISPREARSMDPQQRVLLHTTYEALENAGYVPDATPSFRKEGIGCWVGAATRDYVQNLRNEVDVYYSTGTLAAFLSGRISYAMQLGGPSITVDTACSSSLVAIYQACRALGDRDCNAAIAGGVNIISSPDMMIGLDRGHFLSPTGQCKAFDASADGYSRSEGCGMFVLKRLSDAIAENDNILGIIRGIEVNQSGLAHSITHPHAPTQTALFSRLLENADIPSTRINVVEAHGTGTQAGDPCELESIRSILAANRTVRNPLYVTSIKANIGHLEAASGAAGLAKLLLMLRYRTIPRQILLQNLNPNIAPLESDHTIISTVQSPWIPSQEGRTRVALLNNFGAAGSNVALVLEEFSDARPRTSPPTDQSFVFGLSAKTESSLSVLRSRYIAWLQSPESDGIRLCDIAYTTTTRRQLYPHRIAVTAKSKQELLDRLSKASALHITEHSGKVVFVFSGQGCHYLGMGASLYQTFPIFKQHIDECHSYLVSSGFPGILRIITADAAVIGSDLTQSSTIEAYQTATFALEYALMKLWISWGIKPTAAVGHSLGEFAALVLAKVITPQSALTIIAKRAFLMVRNCALHTSGMLAVSLGHSVVAEILTSSSIFTHLAIACYNSTVQSVISGPTDELDALKRHLDNQIHCKNVNLAVPFAYHSPAMKPVLDDLLVVAKKILFLPPTMPVLSGVYGRAVLPGDGSVFNAQYITRQCAEPVLFDQAISASLLIPEFANAAAWFELGPEVTCLSMIKSNQAFPSHPLLLGTLRKRQDVWTTLSDSLAQLYLSSVDVLWRKPFVHVSSALYSELPPYSFSSAEFWVDFKEERPGLSSYLREPECHPSHLILKYSLLHSWSQFPSDSNGRVAIFETPVGVLAGFIRAHTIGGFHLCPASVYLEQVLAGVDLAKDHLAVTFLNDRVILRNIEFIKPLVYIEQVSRTVKTSITFELDGSGTFTVSSQIGGSDEDSVHVHGYFRHKSDKQIENKLSRCLPFVHRQLAAVMRPIDGTPPETFLARTIYELIFPRVVDYGVAYRTIQSLTIDVNGMEGSAIIKLPIDNDKKPKFVAHPAFMDSLFHVAGFIANMKGELNVVYICNAVGSMRIIPELVDKTASYAIYCCNVWLPEEGIMLADTFALQLGPQRIVAHLKGLQFRRVRFDNFKRGLSLAAGSVASPQHPDSAEYSVSTGITESPALPAQRPFASDMQHQVLSTEVMQIISQTCDIDSTVFDVHTDLASLGVDSLLSIEIFDKLRRLFPHTRHNAQALAFCHTIAEIVEELCPKPSPDLGRISSSSTLNSVADPVLDEAKVMPGSLPVVCTDDVADQMDILSLAPLRSTEVIYSVKDNPARDISHSHLRTHTTAEEREPFISNDSSKTVPGCAAGAKTLPPHIDPESIVKAFRLGQVPVPIQKSSAVGHVPLFLIHDGSGLINYYDRLSPLGRDAWGIHNPHLVNEVPWPWNSLVSMATEYANYVLKVTSDSVLIGGWSFGGVVAFEVARQLLKQGTDARVILIDSPSPVNHVPLPESLLDSVINLDTHSSCSGIRRFVKAQFQLNSRVLGEYNPLPSDGPFPPIVLLRSREGFQAPGISDIPTWLGDRSDGQQAAFGWESLVGCSVSVRDIPGHHFQPFHPSHVEEVSRQISKGCKYLESL